MRPLRIRAIKAGLIKPCVPCLLVKGDDGVWIERPRFVRE